MMKMTTMMKMMMKMKMMMMMMINMEMMKLKMMMMMMVVSLDSWIRYPIFLSPLPPLSVQIEMQMRTSLHASVRSSSRSYE